MSSLVSAALKKHEREPWPKGGLSRILVHSRLDELKGTYAKYAKDAKFIQKQYTNAKQKNDHDAAARVVDRIFNYNTLDIIIDELLKSDKPALVAIPYPEYESEDPTRSSLSKPTNALPFAFAAKLAGELGCDVDDEIVEIARPGRTKLTSFARFRWQPRFAGNVRSDVAYVIADDVCTLGGTLAALRSHIIRGGGTVIAATTLAHRDGTHQQFAIAEETLRVLRSSYTDEVSNFWTTEIGHGIENLTENEGRCLAKWALESEDDAKRCGRTLFESLRDRLSEAAAKGR